MMVVRIEIGGRAVVWRHFIHLICCQREKAHHEPSTILLYAFSSVCDCSQCCSIAVYSFSEAVFKCNSNISLKGKVYTMKHWNIFDTHIFLFEKTFESASNHFIGIKFRKAELNHAYRFLIISIEMELNLQFYRFHSFWGCVILRQEQCLLQQAHEIERLMFKHLHRKPQSMLKPKLKLMYIFVPYHDIPMLFIVIVSVFWATYYTFGFWLFFVKLFASKRQIINEWIK